MNRVKDRNNDSRRSPKKDSIVTKKTRRERSPSRGSGRKSGRRSPKKDIDYEETKKFDDYFDTEDDDNDMYNKFNNMSIRKSPTRREINEGMRRSDDGRRKDIFEEEDGYDGMKSTKKSSKKLSRKENGWAKFIGYITNTVAYDTGKPVRVEEYMDIIRKYYPGSAPVKKKFSAEEHKKKAKEKLEALKSLDDDGTIVSGANQAIKDIENAIRNKR